jgi:CheY-like chemotaxis protein
MQRRRLLSVDDDVAVLAIINTVAAELGFEVESLSNSSRFMTTYVRIKPDVITLDLMMPDMDGIEVVRWLGDVGCTAKVIIVSGHSMFVQITQKLAAARGGLDTTVLQKPFSVTELRVALATAAIASTNHR